MHRDSCLLALLALTAPALASAQSVAFGSKFGVNRATWIADFGVPNPPLDTHTGVVAGPYLTVGFKEIIAVQIEALYSRKGATTDGTFHMDETYFEVPLLLKVALPLWRLPLRAVAMAGIAPAWEVSCSVVHSPFVLAAGSGGPSLVPDDCIGWRTERHDLGRVTAVGFEVPVGRLRITAELRRTWGRENIAHGYAPLSTYNRVKAVVFGMAYALRR